MATKPTITTVTAQAENNAYQVNKATDELADAVATCLERDGTDSMAGNLNMDGNKVTNIGAPTSNTDAVRLVDITAAAEGSEVTLLRTDLGGTSEGQGIDLIGNTDNKIKYMFDSVASMVAEDDLAVGNFVETSNYYSTQVGGGAKYEIVASATGTADGGSYIDLTGSGLQAKLIKPTKVTPHMFGAKGDGTTDDTTALTNAYAYCKSFDKWKRTPFYLSSGRYKTSSALTWDGAVDVCGDGPEKTDIRKSGNYNTINISSDLCDIGGFAVTTTTGAVIAGDGGVGINITSGSLVNYRNLSVYYQGSDGILITAATSSTFNRIVTRHNGGTGFHLNSTGGAQNTNANLYNHIDSLGNDDHGFWSENGDNDYSVGQAIICQQNGKHGAFIESLNNTFSIYAEVNDQDGGGVGAGTYKDIYLSSNSTRNLITIIFATSNSAIYDTGTNNVLVNIGTSYEINVEALGPRTRDSNEAGKGLTVLSGTAGAGATGVSGGNLSFESGSAAGTTGDANGGDVKFTPGAPVNSGRYGYVIIDQNDNSNTVIGSGSMSSLGASLELKSSTKALLINRMTTTQRDNITTPTNGMVIYNSTLNKFQGYENGGWANLI